MPTVALGVKQGENKKGEMVEKDHISLKWGTLKGWNLHTPKCQELLQKYNELGASMSVAMQHDTPEQKKIICDMIDACNATRIFLDWDGKYVSKTKAKEYVMNYGQPQ